MPSQITSDNFHLSPANHNLIEVKIKKVENKLKDVGEELREIRVVVNKAPKFGFIAKAELAIPSASFMCKGTGFSFEGAVDDAVEELTRQVEKHKGKTFKKNFGLLRKFKKHLFFRNSYDI